MRDDGAPIGQAHDARNGLGDWSVACNETQIIDQYITLLMKSNLLNTYRDLVS